ncbi:MAG: hypothetical protein ACI9Y1_001662 [Lentisphaeria bacterium]|jgi:hypothetical protein
MGETQLMFLLVALLKSNFVLGLHMLSSSKKQIAATTLLVVCIAFCEFVGIPALGLSKAQEIAACILLIAAVLCVSEWVSQFVVGLRFHGFLNKLNR